MTSVPSIYINPHIARIMAYHAGSNGGLARIEGSRPAIEHLGRDGQGEKLREHLRGIRGCWVQDHKGAGMVVLGGDKRSPAEALRLLARRKEFGILDRKQGRTVPLRVLLQSLDHNESAFTAFRIVHADRTPEARLAAGLPMEGTDARASAGVALWLAQPQGSLPPSLRWRFNPAGPHVEVQLLLSPQGPLRDRLCTPGVPAKEVRLTGRMDLGREQNRETREVLDRLGRRTPTSQAQVAAFFLDGFMSHERALSSVEQQLASEIYRGLFVAQDQLVQQLGTAYLTRPGTLLDARAYFEADPSLIDFVADHVTRHAPQTPWDWKPWERLIPREH